MKSANSWNLTHNKLHELFKENKLFKPSLNKSFYKDSLSKFERRGKDEGRDLFEFNYEKV